MRKLRTLDQPLPLARLAYEALRDSILSGRLKTGEIYNEMRLAKELGISRTPVREALLELSAQGLVTFLPRKGVIVNHYTEHDVEEIFELRKAIELAAVEKVAKIAGPNNITKIEKVFNDQKAALKKNDYSGFLQADRRFHSLFGEMTNNRRLTAILDNIRDMVHLMGLQALSQTGRREEVIDEHEKTLEALKQGDPAGARKSLEHHLERSRKAVLEQLESQKKE